MPHRDPPAPGEWAGLIVALAITAALLWPVRGYLTDDTFIHLQYARHLAHGDGLVFNVGERVYGCTSPLWVAMLAAAIALGADGVAAAHLLGALATLASVVLFFLLARRTLRSPALRVLATVAWACQAWMLRWSMSGMETPLAVALLLAGFVAFTDRTPWGSRPALTGTLWALFALARPEGAVLLLLWGLFLILDRRSAVRAGAGADPWRRLVLGVAPPAVIYGGWLLFARGYFGEWLANTLVAKTAGTVDLAYRIASTRRAFLILGATDGALGLVLAVSLVMTIVRNRAGARAAPTGVAASERAAGARAAMPPDAAAPGAAGGPAHDAQGWSFPARRPPAGDATPVWLPWAWILLLPVVYVASGIDMLSRYLLLVSPVLAWLAWRGAERWWSPGAREASSAALAAADPRRAVLAAVVLAVVVVIQNGLIYEFGVLPQVRSLTLGMERSLIPMGEWFAANAPPAATIAAPNIGAIGYFSRRRVLDTTGLVTPRMIPILRRESLEDAVARLRFAGFARPEFVIDRADSAYALLARSPYAAAFTPVASVTVPDPGIMRPTQAVYTSYRIDWPAYDALAATR